MLADFCNEPSVRLYGRGRNRNNCCICICFCIIQNTIDATMFTVYCKKFGCLYNVVVRKDFSHTAKKSKSKVNAENSAIGKSTRTDRRIECDHLRILDSDQSSPRFNHCIVCVQWDVKPSGVTIISWPPGKYSLRARSKFDSQIW